MEHLRNDAAGRCPSCGTRDEDYLDADGHLLPPEQWAWRPVLHRCFGCESIRDLRNQSQVNAEVAGTDGSYDSLTHHVMLRPN